MVLYEVHDDSSMVLDIEIRKRLSQKYFTINKSDLAADIAEDLLVLGGKGLNLAGHTQVIHACEDHWIVLVGSSALTKQNFFDVLFDFVSVERLPSFDHASELCNESKKIDLGSILEFNKVLVDSFIEEAKVLQFHDQKKEIPERFVEISLTISGCNQVV